MPDDAAMIEKKPRRQANSTHLKSKVVAMAQPLSPTPERPEDSEAGVVLQDAAAFAEFLVDATQRSILFWDTLRRRANNMMDHEHNGLPPLLKFKYEVVADAAEYDPPANYKLLKILEADDVCLDDCLDPEKPPLMIIDPRAGHGPGIGGFKRESEVGIALHEGYPVYFVVFAADPEPGQTLANVLHALRRFVETLSSLHGEKPPILYGNCQGGWAAALLAAGCGGLAGPVVMNGSPLSYWAGEAGTNPMRLAGGFVGGSWMTHFLSDLGGGVFDGAWLVQNFENLKPESAIWRKYADLYLDVDDEQARFLEFEKWWSGFYRFSREEMLAIVENLFIGNRIEQGLVKICHGCIVDLKKIHNPLIIFASYGDNITPPHQALGWIPAVYRSTEELINAGQRIVYLINQHAGHLGLFVSADVARFEHRAILESIADIESLAPGLYEMRIENPTGDPDCDRNQYSVLFERRRVKDLSFDYSTAAFENVRAFSQAAEGFYAKFFSPWVRAFASPMTVEALRWAHPMRASRYIYSEKLNPFMSIVATTAEMAEKSRSRADPRNPYLEAELRAVQNTEDAIRRWRIARDSAGEQIFNWLYNWPTSASWFAWPKSAPPQSKKRVE